jgi:hypothetical protein
MIRFILVLGTALVLIGCAAHDGDAQRGAGNGRKAGTLVAWPTKAQGYGKTVDDARKNSVTSAVEVITGCLKKQDPPLETWQPDEEYVRKHLLDGPGYQGEDLKIGVGDNPEIAKVWVQPITPTPDWGAMVQLDHAAQRRELSAGRQTIAGYGLAILTALLLVGWGYFRVDDWTKGRFTKWLCIGAITALALTGLGWLTSN